MKLRTEVKTKAVKLLGSLKLANMALSAAFDHWEQTSAFTDAEWTTFIIRSSISKMALIPTGGRMTTKMKADDLVLAASILDASLPLTEGHVLQEHEREALNKALVEAGFDGTKKFRSVRWSMTDLEAAVETVGIHVSGINSANIFSTDNGKATVKLARRIGDDESGTDISNAAIYVSWHNVRPDAVEVTAHCT